MNNTILRGFCDNCSWPIILFSDSTGKFWPVHIRLLLNIEGQEVQPFFCQVIQPNWVLSTDQMNKLENYFGPLTQVGWLADKLKKDYSVIDYILRDKVRYPESTKEEGKKNE